MAPAFLELGGSDCEERSVSSSRTAHGLGQLTFFDQSGEYFALLCLPHGEMSLDDFHRCLLPVRFLPPTLVFLLSPSFRFYVWVMGYCALLLRRELL